MLSIDALKELGCDTDAGLARCMNNETFYLRLVNMALQDGGFSRLNEAVGAGNLGDAFEAAHALKGMLGNVSLSSLVTPIEEITELLRNRTEADYAPLLEKINGEYEKLKALL